MRGDFKPGEVLVRFKRSTDPSEREAALDQRSAKALDRTGSGLTRVALPKGTTVLEAIDDFESDPTVGMVQANRLSFLTQTPTAVIPDDERFVHQWGLNNTGQGHPVAGVPERSVFGSDGADIQAPEAWARQTGSAEAVIAIMDSGVDLDHPDIEPNLWVNPDEIAGNGQDDDGNGLKDDVNGWDFADNDSSLLEASNILGADHGTHVAGIAAGALNGSGIVGVCPGCRIMVLKVGEAIDTDLDGQPDTVGIDEFSIVKAFAYAAAEGADVVNASFAAPIQYSNAERSAIARAGRKGVLTVAAAGNFAGNNDQFLFVDLGGSSKGFLPGPDVLAPVFPASYNLNTILSVGTTTDDDEYGFSTICNEVTKRRAPPCAFTNYGRVSVDVAAPGVDVLSSVPGGFDTFDGTSMSAPHAAGVAGLVISEHPNYTPFQVRNAIVASSKVLTSLRFLFALPNRKVIGSFSASDGRVDALEALTQTPTARAEFDDGTIENARPIFKRRTGRLEWPEDVNDVFRKNLKAHRIYTITLNGFSDADLDLYIWKSKTKEIWQFEQGCLGGAGRCLVQDVSAVAGRGDESVRFVVQTPGIYYIHVAAYLLQNGQYALKVASERT